MSEDSSADGNLNKFYSPERLKNSLNRGEKLLNIKIFQSVKSYLESRGVSCPEFPLNQRIVDQR